MAGSAMPLWRMCCAKTRWCCTGPGWRTRRCISRGAARIARPGRSSMRRVARSGSCSPGSAAVRWPDFGRGSAPPAVLPPWQRLRGLGCRARASAPGGVPDADLRVVIMLTSVQRAVISELVAEIKPAIEAAFPVTSLPARSQRWYRMRGSEFAKP